jgi:hypothetical protein
MLKFLLLFIFLPIWGAQDVVIFGTAHSISLENGKKEAQDFYINAGSARGVKKGHVINIIRKKPLYDQFTNKTIGDLMVPVGKLKIIHTQSDVSVGRVYEIYDRQDLPILDYSNIMVGDRLDMNSATFSSGKTSSSSTSESKSEIQQEKKTLVEKIQKKIKSITQPKVSLPKPDKKMAIKKKPKPLPKSPVLESTLN